MQMRSLIAVGAAGSLALAPTAVSFVSLVANPSSFEFECGPRGPGAPGEVVVHLLDKVAPAHGRLLVKAKMLEPEEQDSAAQGTIRLESKVGGVPFMCESIGPGHFAVHSTSALLRGTSLQVFTMKPVPVELEDSQGKLLARGMANPASSAAVNITW